MKNTFITWTVFWSIPYSPNFLKISSNLPSKASYHHHTSQPSQTYFLSGKKACLHFLNSVCWNPISTKNTEISQAWWHMPVIPATQEAEAGVSLEHRRQRLQGVEMTPLHSSLGGKSHTPSQNKKKKGPGAMCQHLMGLSNARWVSGKALQAESCLGVVITKACQAVWHMGVP